LGIVSTNEPFQKLYNQGMILAFAYETASGSKVPSDLVTEKEGKYFHNETGEELRQIVAKMSKSLKNVVNPDDVVEKFGADSLRLYEMFIGPLDATKPWTENGVKGVYNFLRRVAAFFGEKSNLTEGAESKETLKILHQTIKKVGDDVEEMKFNTAISQMMVFTNHCYKAGKVAIETANTFYQVLAPFAPHLAEELWALNGNAESVGIKSWPIFNPDFLTEEVVEYPVSFNGKVRFKLELPVGLTAKEVEEAALKSDMTKKWTEGNTIVKIIVVPGKIVNIVIK
ncbi:MAG: class I tRNA ligase family protein, partial [Bacteroidetes bacterium]|nr:class I tRNA ligase family protein [Bacteroidota bacterium]